MTDLAWHDGKRYAVQIGLLQGGLGQLVRVDTGGDHETITQAFAPYGVAVHDDDAYLTTCAVCAGGSVIKVPVA